MRPKVVFHQIEPYLDWIFAKNRISMRFLSAVDFYQKLAIFKALAEGFNLHRYQTYNAYSLLGPE
jgi:hypothetical protein